MLPESSQDIKGKTSSKSNPRNTFLESLRVSPEELSKNIEIIILLYKIKR